MDKRQQILRAARLVAAREGFHQSTMQKITAEAEELAASLGKAGPISEEHSEDALHIALATVNGMDFLLTWNFSHINNAIIKKGIISVAENHGYECPVICSPDELLGEPS